MPKLRAGINELCPMCPQIKKERDDAYAELSRIYADLVTVTQATNSGRYTLPVVIDEVNYILKNTLSTHLEKFLGGKTNDNPEEL